MNIVDFIIIAVLAYGLFAGMYKGSITSGISLIGFGGAWFGAQAVYGRISHFALSNSTLMAVLNQYLEPDSFFENHAHATMAVSDVIAGGEAAMRSAVESVSGTFSFIADAFNENIRMQAFQNIGISSLSDYFNQTLWVAVFNVVAFLAAFIVLYIVINLVVNMLDRVISFPVLRGFDWLIGGVFGFLRASVVVVLILTILPMLTNLIDPALTNELITGSTLFTFAYQFDLLGAVDLVKGLIAG